MINAGNPGGSPKGGGSGPPKGGNPKGGGLFDFIGKIAVLSLIWPWLKIFLPFIIGLIAGLLTRSLYFGFAAFLVSGGFLWRIGTGFRTLLFIVAAVIFFLGTSASEGVKSLSIMYGKSIGSGISTGWRTASLGVSCSLCKATNAMNPAACEEKCDLGILSTEPLLEFTYEVPGAVSHEMPISVDVKLKLLAKDETVKNLAVDVWIVNETDCTFDYCIPEEMYACPKKSECVKIVEMSCGESSNCYCQNSYCELNKDGDERNVVVWLYNPTCHSKKDVRLYPQMKIQYEFVGKGFHKIRVAKSEASSPSQKESKSVGPLSISMYSNKNVYILDKMFDNLNTGNLKIRLTNTGEGYAYIKSININQEHTEKVGSFDIVECPGFSIEKDGETTKLSLEEKKTFSLSPRDQSTVIDCIMNVPSEGITKFNEYTFSAYVAYQYKEERTLPPVSLNCKLAY